MAHSPEEIKKHVRIYIGIFVALMIFTVLTVAVSYFHLPIGWAVAIALLVASIKGTLVAGFFMHLFQEKPLVLIIFFSSLFLFFVLITLTVFD